MVLRPKNNSLAVEVRSVRTGTLSEVSAKGGFWCNVYTGMLNAGRFVEFLKDFRKGGRGRVFLVVDGHPSHRAKIVEKYVLGTKGIGAQPCDTSQNHRRINDHE